MVLICVFFSIMNARQAEHEELKDPCASIHIIKAQKEGLRSLSILEFRSYNLDIKLCEDIIGTSRPFDAIEKKLFYTNLWIYFHINLWIYSIILTKRNQGKRIEIGTF